MQLHSAGISRGSQCTIIFEKRFSLHFLLQNGAMVHSKKGQLFTYKTGQWLLQNEAVFCPVEELNAFEFNYKMGQGLVPKGRDISLQNRTQGVTKQGNYYKTGPYEGLQIY